MSKFLNVSNHPSFYWLEDQVEAALHLIRSTNREDIIDIQFPNVPPTASKKEVEAIGRQVIKQINKMDDVEYAHIMGEMSLVYFLVRNLNLKVVVSTTERIELDGKKEFKFVQFREY